MKYLSFAAKEFFQHSEKNDEEICNRLEITGKGHIDIDIHSPPSAPLSLRIHFPYLLTSSLEKHHFYIFLIINCL